MAKKQSIKINPKNAGKLRAKAKAKKGQKIPVSELQRMKKSKNATTKQQATFALNARKFKH